MHTLINLCRYEARTKLNGFMIKPDAPLKIAFANKWIGMFAMHRELLSVLTSSTILALGIHTFTLNDTVPKFENVLNELKRRWYTHFWIDRTKNDSRKWPLRLAACGQHTVKIDCCRYFDDFKIEVINLPSSYPDILARQIKLWSA